MRACGTVTMSHSRARNVEFVNGLDSSDDEPPAVRRRIDKSTTDGATSYRVKKGERVLVKKGDRVLVNGDGDMHGGIVTDQSTQHVTVLLDGRIRERDFFRTVIYKQPANIHFAIGRFYYRHWSAEEGWIRFRIEKEPYEWEDSTIWALVKFDRVPNDTFNDFCEIQLDQKTHAMAPEKPGKIRFVRGERYYIHWSADEGWIGFRIKKEPYEYKDYTKRARVKLDRSPDEGNKVREIELDQQKHAFREW